MIGLHCLLLHLTFRRKIEARLGKVICCTLGTLNATLVLMYTFFSTDDLVGVVEKEMRSVLKQRKETHKQSCGVQY